MGKKRNDQVPRHIIYVCHRLPLVKRFAQSLVTARLPSQGIWPPGGTSRPVGTSQRPSKDPGVSTTPPMTHRLSFTRCPALSTSSRAALQVVPG
jgi:hypothetical protein